MEDSVCFYNVNNACHNARVDLRDRKVSPEFCSECTFIERDANSLEDTRVMEKPVYDFEIDKLTGGY